MAQIWQDKINPFPYEEPYEYLGPQPTGHNLENYNPRPTEADATTTVSTGQGLFDAIDNASSGDIIWIDSASTCEVTDLPRHKNIPSGTTIASNGGRIFQNSAKNTVFYPEDTDNIRITGIRFEGHYIGNLDPYDSNEIARAFIIQSTNVEIDHCEFYGWTGAGVFVGANSDTPRNQWAPHIHHCRFWDNRMSGLGYGIAVYSGDPDIEYCTFNNNRHSIATGGADECAYDVRDSWHGPNTKIDGFEQHDPGGLRSIVRYCEFADMVKNQSGNTAPVYTQRGTPIETAEIHNNHLHDPQETHATTADLDGQQIIQYDHGSTEFVDVNHYDNHYGETDVPASAGIREPATTSDGDDTDHGRHPQ